MPDSSTVRFNFSYDSTSNKYGYLNASGSFVPFEEGGTDVSDTTATANKVLSGYTFYLANGVKTSGTYIPLDTSDTTAYADNIEEGYTAYCRGSKITGTLFIRRTIYKYQYNISDLSSNKMYVGDATINNYAIFAGGYYSFPSYGSDYSYNTVEAYNVNYTKQSLTNLREVKHNMGSGSVGNYAIFAGGNSHPSGSSQVTVNTVDTYNTSLSKGTATSLSSNKSGLRGVTIGNYIIFFQDNFMQSYNTSLTRGSVSALSISRFPIATAIGDYALFAGGWYAANYTFTNYDTVDTYNKSLTRGTCGGLSVGRSVAMAATIPDKYALFVDGQTGYYSGSSAYYTNQNVVDSYNTSLTRTSKTDSFYTSGKGSNTDHLAFFIDGSMCKQCDTQLTDTKLEYLPNMYYGNGCGLANTDSNHIIVAGGMYAPGNGYTYSSPKVYAYYEEV